MTEALARQTGIRHPQPTGTIAENFPCIPQSTNPANLSIHPDPRVLLADVEQAGEAIERFTEGNEQGDH